MAFSLHASIFVLLGLTKCLVKKKNEVPPNVLLEL